MDTDIESTLPLNNSFESHYNVFQLSRHVCEMYSYAPYIIGIPQAVLNMAVILVLLTGFLVLKQKWNPGLVYLLNLAMSDVSNATVLCLITS